MVKRAPSRSDVTEVPPVKSTIDKNDELYQLCLELETFLVKNLLNSMRSTVQKSGFADDSFAGKMYEDMLYDEYAKDFTKNANFGLAEQAYRQLKRSIYE
jgi:flagellar protein FlgJ